MAKAHAKKKKDIINELCAHSDLIGDEKVKSFIKKIKTEKAKVLAKKHGIHKKATLFDSEDEDEEMVPAVA